MNLQNYYLDLPKVHSLSDEQQKQINNYYLDMLHSQSDPQRVSMSLSLFNTLYENGYLREVRGEKIDKILSDE